MDDQNGGGEKVTEKDQTAMKMMTNRHRWITELEHEVAAQDERRRTAEDEKVITSALTLAACYAALIALFRGEIETLGQLPPNQIVIGKRRGQLKQ